MTIFHYSRISILSLTIALEMTRAIQARATNETKPKNNSNPSVSVGMIGKIDQIVIPGGELEAVSVSDSLAKIVVRVADTFRHGDAFRYNLEFTGFEPGRYDLAKSLKRKNPNETSANIPPIEIEIMSVLEPGRIEPTRPAASKIRRWLKYWTKLDFFVVVWIIGLALLWGRTRKVAIASNKVQTPPPTVAERLKPLVRAACEGSIAPHQRAGLESLLIGY